MNKRIFSMMLVLMVAIASFSFACAEAVPSVTIETVVNVSTAVSSTGVVLPETFKVEVVPQSETVVKVVEEIAEVVKAAPVATYFGEEVMAAVAEKLPVEVETSALKLNELTTLKVAEYDAAYEDVVVTLALTAEYAEDDAIVVLVGIVVDGVLTWVPMDATIVDGQVNVTFTQEILTAAGEGEMLFALLRAE